MIQCWPLFRIRNSVDVGRSQCLVSCLGKNNVFWLCFKTLRTEKLMGLSKGWGSTRSCAPPPLPIFKRSTCSSNINNHYALNKKNKLSQQTLATFCFLVLFFARRLIIKRSASLGKWYENVQNIKLTTPPPPPRFKIPGYTPKSIPYSTR